MNSENSHNNMLNRPNGSKHSYTKYHSVLAAILMLLPRVSATYAIYTIVPIIISDFERRFALIFFVLFASIFSIAIASFRFEVSPTASLLEFALTLPFFLGAFGARLRKSIDAIDFVRALNIGAMIASFISLWNLGFPFRLPYLHYAPDYYYSFFGLGGAKIVTIIGFLGVYSELFFSKSTSRKHPFWLLASLLNFMLPSFLIGIVSGVVALSLSAIRKPLIAFVTIVSTVAVAPYFLFRLENLSGNLGSSLGLHPKIYQFKISLDYFTQDTLALVFGVGPGQFGGQAALWASPAGDIISSFSRPSLPGLFAAEPHMSFLAPIMLQFASSPSALNSSFNKPYSSMSVMIVEYGLLFTILVFSAMAFRFVLGKHRSAKSISFFIFIMMLLMIDLQHDSPWFGLVVIIANTLIYSDRDKHEKR